MESAGLGAASEITSRAGGSGTRLSVFRLRRGVLNLWFALGGIAVLQGLATFAYFAYEAEDVEEPLRSVALFLATSLSGFGLYFFTYAVGRMRDLEPPITIGPAGLHDRWLSERPIPWRSVQAMRVHRGGRGGPYVVFDVAEKDADEAGVWPLRHEMARLSRRIAGYGFRIHHMGVETTTADLVEAIRPYAVVAGAEEVLRHG